MKKILTSPDPIKSNWWDDYSPQRKRAYLRRYPNSKYAGHPIGQADPKHPHTPKKASFIPVIRTHTFKKD